MFVKAKSVAYSQLVRGSFVMFVGSMLTNFSNYIYTVLMGRLLGPVDYGILISLVSLLYILAVPSLTLNTVCVKFSSEFQAKQNYHKIWMLFFNLTKKVTIFGAVLIYLFLILSYPIAHFLKLSSNRPVIILALVIVTSFLWTLNSSILQGVKNFNFLSFSNVLGALLKLGFGALFVILGFAVNGALIGFILGYLLPYVWSFPALSLYRKSADGNLELEGGKILKFALPTLVAVFGLTLMINLDIILVKRYFVEDEAGLYAALSLIGKIIFFAAASVVAVMFPLISEKHTGRLSYLHIFKGTLIIVSLICFGLTIFYFIFPLLVVRFVFGSNFLTIAPYVGLFGVFISLYCLGYVFVNFFLAVHRTAVAHIPLFFAVLQAILIVFYHDSFWQVINASLVSTALLLFVLVGYYIRVGGYERA